MLQPAPASRWLRIRIAIRSWKRRIVTSFRTGTTWIKHLPRHWKKEPEAQVLDQIVTRHWPNSTELRAFLHTLPARQKRAILIVTMIGVMVLAGAISLFAKEHIIYTPGTGGAVTEAVLNTPSFSILHPLYPTERPGETRVVHDLFLPLATDTSAIKTVPEDTTSISEWMLAAIPENQKSLARTARDIPGKRYYILLRQSVTWADNSPVIAKDVIDSIEAIQSISARSPLRNLFTGVTATPWENTNDRGVIITLASADPEWGAQALGLRIAPSNVIENISMRDLLRTSFSQKPIGNSGWNFSSLTREADDSISNITLTRTPTAPGSLDSYTYLATDGPSDAIEYMTDNKIDFFATPIRTIGDTDLRGLQVETIPGFITLSLTINRTTSSLKQTQDRRALLAGLQSVRDESFDTIPSEINITDIEKETRDAIHASVANALVNVKPWSFKTPVGASTTWDLLVPEEYVAHGEWEAIVGEANLSLQRLFGAKAAPSIALSTVDSMTFDRRYRSGDYDIALVPQTMLQKNDLRHWWFGTGDNGLLARDPLRDRALDQFATTNMSTQDAITALLTEWPGMPWTTTGWVLVGDPLPNGWQKCTLANQDDWKSLLWRNGTISWDWSGK